MIFDSSFKFNEFSRSRMWEAQTIIIVGDSELFHIERQQSEI